MWSSNISSGVLGFDFVTFYRIYELPPTFYKETIHMNYGYILQNTVWGGAAAPRLVQLSRLQKKCEKILTDTEHNA